MRRIPAAGLLLLGAAALSACATAPGGSAPTATAELPEDAYGTWQSPVEGAFLEIHDDGTFGGNDGCNGFGGDYTVGDGVLELEPGFTTQMFCEGVDDWLKNTVAVGIAGDALVAYGAQGEELGQLARG